MAATFVKCTKLPGAINSNVASGTVAATAGNQLYVVAQVYYGGTATTPTLSVSGQGTWTVDDRNNQHFTSSNDNFAEGAAHLASATGGSATVTVTWGVTASGSVAGAYVYEFSGSPGTFDAAASGTQGTASPAASPTFTNPNASDILLAAACTYSTGGTETHGAPSNSWTMPTNGDETDANNRLTGVTAYKIVSASASQSTAWTVSPSVAWTSQMWCYKAATATTFNITVSATQAQSLSLARVATYRRTTSASQAQSASVATLAVRKYLLTGSATQAQSVSVGVRPSVRYSQTVSTSQAQSLSLAQAFAHLPIDYYSTSFPLTENPISENNVWTLGGRDALDWTNPRTTPGKMFATQGGADSVFPSYKDSIAAVRGTWGADQEVIIQIFNSLGNVNAYCEAEALLRFTILPHQVTGYEVTLNTNPVNSYIEVNRWNGLINGGAANYTQIGSTTGKVNQGDIIRATVVGSTINVYRNGTLILGPITDTTYTSGAPGAGMFYNQNGGTADVTLWGIARFTAHTIGTPWPAGGTILQPQTLRLAQQAQIRRTLNVAQLITLVRSVRLTRAIVEATAVFLPLVPRVFPLARAITQAQAASITLRKVVLRDLNLSQSQTVRLASQVRLPRALSVTTLPTLLRAVGLVRAAAATMTSVNLTIRGTGPRTYPITGVATVHTGAVLTFPGGGSTLLTVTAPVRTSARLEAVWIRHPNTTPPLQPSSSGRAPALAPISKSNVPPLWPG